MLFVLLPSAPTSLTAHYQYLVIFPSRMVSSLFLSYSDDLIVLLPQEVWKEEVSQLEKESFSPPTTRFSYSHRSKTCSHWKIKQNVCKNAHQNIITLTFFAIWKAYTWGAGGFLNYSPRIKIKLYSRINNRSYFVLRK